MKKTSGFLVSLEKYVYQTAGRSPLPRLQQLCCKHCGQAYTWILIGVIAIVMAASLANVKNSMVGMRDTKEAIEKAASRGDYGLAKKLFEQRTENIEYRVLGAESELEEKVYPERVVEHKIAELESELTKYPNHFEMNLELARLNALIGQDGKASEYREKARVLDPNNEVFK